MLQQDMTRKEFLSVVAALFGLAVLSRLPLGGGMKSGDAHTPGSFGNHVYGGGKRQ